MLRTLIALSLLVCGLAAQGPPASWEALTLEDGQVLTYKLGLPADFSPQGAHPALLALPPGAQTPAMVDASWQRYWAEQASSRGWIVVSPVVPDGHTFLDGTERVLRELMDHVLARLPVEHGRFHLAGVSNGGRAAFRAATLWPEAFLSLTVLPGYPSELADQARLERLVDLPVGLYVGGDDAYWLEQTHDTAERLRALGVSVSTTVVPGEGHTPPSLDGDVIMEHLETLRAGPTTRSATTTLFVVRHAEKRGQDDVLSEAGEARAEALARLLEPTALDAIYATEYARTQATVAPTAAAQGLTTRVLSARADTAAHLLREHVGEAVLVAGHSNTVPAILRGLGVSERITIAESRYGDLFVVTVTDGAAHLVRLRY